MSQPSSPTNRIPIFGWVKNLKRAGLTLNDSLNDVSETDLATTASKSPTRSLFSIHSGLPHAQAIPFPPVGKDAQSTQGHQSSLVHLLQHLDLLRPLLNHKSRSTNNVNRIRSNSASNQNASQDSFNIRQHRDSFLQNNPLVDENLKYFGVPLADAIAEASAKISILGSESTSDDVLQYGRIPIVVAKCGVFLKKNGLAVEGIFRVGGLSKRIKELQIIFSTPPEFGKKLNWDGYTVHDAALVLRRYLNALPEPLILLNLYDEFRDPLRSRQRIIKYLKYKAEHPRKLKRDTSTPSTPASSKASNTLTSTPVIVATSSAAETIKDTSASEASNVAEKAETASTAGSLSRSSRSRGSKPKSYKKLTRDVYDAIDEYKQLLDELPELSKQLLFYILDLLAMVQSNSQENLMSSRNLAAIFQPSILLHPNHDMDPEEYALSQSVVEFLIQHAYKLLPSNDLPKPAVSELPAPAASEQPTSKTAEDDKLAVRASGRPHSRSLTGPGADVDLIGYSNNARATGSLTLSDAEFASASSDEECGSEVGYGLPKPSAPPNLMSVLGASAGEDAASKSSPDAPAPPPISISDVSRDVGT